MNFRSALPAVVFAVAAPSAFALAPGDLAFTAINADEDGFAMVALIDIPASTTVFFCDNEWDGTVFNGGEGYLEWISGALIPAGSVVRFAATDTATPVVTANAATNGAMTRVTVSGSANWGFAAGGDTLYAYQGASATVPTTFLAAISTSTFSVANGVLTNTGLTIGNGALQTGFAGGSDFAQYTGARAGQAAFAGYLSLVSNIANWEDLGDGVYPATVPNTTSFTTGGPAPETLTVTLLPTSISENGGTSTATITRTGTAAVTINLASNDTTEATLPATVDIPENVASVDVTVTAQNDSIFDGSQLVAITASQTGHLDGTANLTVTDDFLDVPALTVNEIYHTPDSDVNGDTLANSDDEFVELVNTSGADLDISNWTVSDVGALRHTFAAGTVLAPNQAILVFATLPASPATIGGSLAVACSTGNLGIAASDSVVIRNSSAVEIHRINYTSTPSTPEQSLNLVSEPNPSAYLKHNDIAGITTDLSPGTRVDGTPWVVLPSLTVSVTPATFLENAGVLANAGTVTASVAPMTDLTVNLSSSDATELTVPATVTLLANTTSVSFNVTPQDEAVVDADAVVTLGAGASGYLPDTFQVTVQNNEIPAVPTLATGDIAFTRFNADGNDDISFVALKAIPAGEEIYFTDNLWNGLPVGSGGDFTSTESEWRWTAPVGGVAAGAIVTITNISTAIATNAGSVEVTDNTGLGLNATADTVYAFQGAPGAPVHFLASIANTNADTIFNTGLTPDIHAIFLPNSTDGGGYIGARNNQATYPAYLAQIGNVVAGTTWQIETADGTLVPNNTTAFTLLSGFAAWAAGNGIPGALSTADSDDDGVINLVEYFFNQDPANGGDLANMPALVRNGGALQLGFTRLTTLPDAAGTLETSGDLLTWTDALPGIDYTVLSSVPSGDETVFTYALPGTGPSAPGVSATYLTPNNSDPVGASLGGVRVINEGLVGVGRLSGESLDKFGETQGAASGLFITDWTYAANQFSGTFHVLPDRGHGDGTSNYSARLHEVDFTFTPYYGTTAVPQGQVVPTYADSTKFTYQDGATVKFTTGLNPTGTSNLFAQTVGTITTANGPGGAQESLLSFDAEAVHLFADGSGFVSDEYGTYIARFNASKQITGLTQLPGAARPHRPAATPNFDSVTAPNNGRRNNQGLEGMSVTPDGTLLFALLQSATVQDTNGSQQQTRNHARLFVYNVAGANRENPVLTGEYIVRLPQIDLDPNTAPSALNGTAAQSEIVALGQSSFLMLPRDGNGMGKGTTVPITFKSVQLVDFASATNILGMFDGVGQAVSPGGVLDPLVTAAATAEVINMLEPTDLAKFGLNTNTNPSNANTLNEKIEGMALVPDISTPAANDFFLFIANDNDFQSSDVKMLNAAGVVVSKGEGRLNAGITNDAMFYAYRMTIDAGGRKFFRMDVTENN
jgi:hypothetical protein